MSPSLKGQVETVLFLTGRALTMTEIAEKLMMPAEEVEQAVLDLINDYSFRDDCALEIDDADGYILQVKDDYRTVVDRMVPIELSQAVLRTLSVIAVHGPLKQADLIELRGANAYEHVKVLMQQKLISRKRLKRGYSLSVSPVFHEYFKLSGDKNELKRMVSQFKANDADLKDDEEVIDLPLPDEVEMMLDDIEEKPPVAALSEESSV